MNFVKRAGMSLRARKSRTAALLGIFVVICALLLGGFLLEAAAARQEAEAQRRIGVDVTVRGEVLTADRVARLGSRAPVTRYNPLLTLTAGPRGFDPLVSPEPPPPGEREGGPLAMRGVRDLGMLLPFSYGSTKITSGRGIDPRDTGRRVAVVEERLAEKNGLEVGDTIRVRSYDGERTVTMKVLGVFRDPRKDPPQWTPPDELPGNTVYVPTPLAERLGEGAAEVDEAVFRIGSPEQAERLHAEARRLLGTGDFDFRVNDKAYQDQVRPIQRVGAFAGLIVWVIALAGALVLGLIVMLQIRERREELGVLLSMGEKKWKLITQHAVEIAVVCLPAIAVAALAGHLAAPSLGDALLDRPPRHTAGGVPDTAMAPPTVRVEPADVGKVAGIGLGICLVSTVVPGIGVLRLHPRSILAVSE
ncbi:ABC transporter permease [Streptomyces sp. B93]|uniref:ABC transporter permease n=1 Tax=Streptomyces sp. B93 TaxID=2824875 RepID=UPI001B36897D|nr:ABC transporter permease [Streptomyces sp. B93]MBQ1092837.1 ABC transporter permease [Streptomyces sp. B93]